MSEFVSQYCEGERCRCGQPAARKIAEVILDDDPYPLRHEYTQYVCQEHFNEVMRPYIKRKNELFQEAERLFAQAALPNPWLEFPKYQPTEYGRYEVYRAKAKKQHYLTWNNVAWSSDHNTVTHFRKIIAPV